MQYQPHTTDDPPTAEQLSGFVNIAEKLRTHPEAVTVKDKDAFKEHVLSLSPGEIDPAVIGLLSIVFPSDFQPYLDFHFGTSKECFDGE